MATHPQNVDAATIAVREDIRTEVRNALKTFDTTIQAVMDYYGSSAAEKLAVQSQMIDIARWLEASLRGEGNPTTTTTSAEEPTTTTTTEPTTTTTAEPTTTTPGG